MVAARRSAAARRELRGPTLPAAYEPLWECFLELHKWRGTTGMGPAPLTLHDVAAWEARYLPAGVRLDAADVELLKQLDIVALTESK